MTIFIPIIWKEFKFNYELNYRKINTETYLLKVLLDISKPIILKIISHVDTSLSSECSVEINL